MGKRSQPLPLAGGSIVLIVGWSFVTDQGAAERAKSHILRQVKKGF